MIKNDLLLRALSGQEVSRPPVWTMRQAGRILPEYRKVRQSVSGFKELVQTPELAAEVTIQPVDILGVDAAIMFSDILVVPEAMGFDYEMVEKKGPFFPKTILSPDANLLLQAEVDVEDRLSYVTEAIELILKGLDNRVPLIGFAGAPWTIFCYLTEGQGSKTFSEPRKWLYQNAAGAHSWMQKITDVTIAYLKMQVAAGVHAVQVFDSWAGVLNQQLYKEFAIPYLKQICDAITEVPVILFSKGAWFSLDDIAQLPCAAMGLDWQMNPEPIRAKFPNLTLQGNLDPTCLYGSEEIIEKHVNSMLDSFGTQRYIANLGHGVYPDTDRFKVKYFIDLIKNSN